MALWRLALALTLVPSTAGAQLDQSHLAGQAHDLGEEFGEFNQMLGTEVADGAVGGEVVRCQHPKGDVFMQLPGDLARAEDARGVGIDQDFDHHGRVQGWLRGPPPA